MKHQKKRDKCIQMHYIGKSYVNTVYKCDDGKKSDHSEKKVWQVYTMHYIGKSYVTTVYKCDDEKKSDHPEKKSVTSVYNALYREKLWNHCIQVWRWKKKLTASWDKYFLMILKKKRDKCIQMHYIGKSYVTTVYKCDNRLRRAVIREYMGQIFSDEAQKKRDKCIQCII